jgi:type II secretory pathway component PulJ
MRTRSQTQAIQQQARRNDEMLAAMGLLALHTMSITQRITNKNKQK